MHFTKQYQIQTVKERKTSTDNKEIKFCQNGDNGFKITSNEEIFF